MGSKDSNTNNIQSTLFGAKLLKGLSNTVVTEEALKDADLVALYFSASW